MKFNQNNQLSNVENAFAHKIVARLQEGLQDIPHDLNERLRVARNLALSQYVAPKAVANLNIVTNGSSLIWGRSYFGSFFNQLISVFPLVILLCGLLVIQNYHDQSRARELADLDTELLTDELPPSAFTDPGFAQFLRAKASSE